MNNLPLLFSNVKSELLREDFAAWLSESYSYLIEEGCEKDDNFPFMVLSNSGIAVDFEELTNLKSYKQEFVFALETLAFLDFCDIYNQSEASAMASLLKDLIDPTALNERIMDDADFLSTFLKSTCIDLSKAQPHEIGFVLDAMPQFFIGQSTLARAEKQPDGSYLLDSQMPAIALQICKSASIDTPRTAHISMGLSVCDEFDEEKELVSRSFFLSDEKDAPTPFQVMASPGFLRSDLHHKQETIAEAVRLIRSNPILNRDETVASFFKELLIGITQIDLLQHNEPRKSITAAIYLNGIIECEIEPEIRKQEGMLCIHGEIEHRTFQLFPKACQEAGYEERVASFLKEKSTSKHSRESGSMEP